MFTCHRVHLLLLDQRVRPGASRQSPCRPANEKRPLRWRNHCGAQRRTRKDYSERRATRDNKAPPALGVAAGDAMPLDCSCEHGHLGDKCITAATPYFSLLRTHSTRIRALCISKLCCQQFEQEKPGRTLIDKALYGSFLGTQSRQHTRPRPRPTTGLFSSSELFDFRRLA